MDCSLSRVTPFWNIMTSVENYKKDSSPYTRISKSPSCVDYLYTHILELLNYLIISHHSIASCQKLVRLASSSILHGGVISLNNRPPFSLHLFPVYTPIVSSSQSQWPRFPRRKWLQKIEFANKSIFDNLMSKSWKEMPPICLAF